MLIRHRSHVRLVSRSRPLTARTSAMGTNNKHAPLVVVGSVNADLVLPIARLPLSGETLSAPSIETFPGGKVTSPHHRLHPTRVWNTSEI